MRQKLQLACFNSLWPEARMGALGLSHGLGHKLGATYGIGHGITSCITLGTTVRFVANWKDTPSNTCRTSQTHCRSSRRPTTPPRHPSVLL